MIIHHTSVGQIKIQPIFIKGMKLFKIVNL